MSNSESTTATGIDGFDDSKADVRRYAIFIPDQIVEGSSMPLDEEDADDNASLLTDFVSAWESTTGPIACAADPKLSDSVLSEAQELNEKHQKQSDGVTEAQRIVQEYLQRNKTIEDQGTTNVCPLNTAKELPVTPNNRDSTCTHAVTDDGQFTIDLEKRPELEVRLFHHDPEGVAQAQLQGLEMVQTGHYTPGAMIRCERPGCTDVLRNLEALKCHLHIHNIGDMTDAISVLYGNCQRAKELGHSSTESSPLNKFSRKVRDRSRSITDLDAPSGSSCDPTRKVYTKDPCSSSRSRKAGAVDAPHTRTKLPDALTPQTRGRRSNRSTIRGGLDEAGYHDTIAMVLSRPPSPVQGAREALGSDMNLPVNKSGVLSPSVSPTLGEKELPRATSPKRFSPGRALSPIRGMSYSCILFVQAANIFDVSQMVFDDVFIRMLEWAQ
ncbi:uncharacterized protein HD556DRAFT_1306830 [Suillus plorans]|uniref:Uncharacterized protein n=1 Tax=Suillus plorans TaxID=116603 RepID=A0A9P7ATP6_9AGAM|nr:uncharacterized protein HD556DRAFT_1306830 [Suillus plorans]KAG1796628.1 hypothetical protein HD556DRAFT_1306830 [Suillus plorans]